MPPGTDSNATQAAEGDASEKYLHVRVTKQLKKDVRGAAGHRDQDMSEYIREVLGSVSRSDYEIEELLTAAEVLANAESEDEDDA